MKIKIGARVKELRKRHNVTQEQLAEALGVTNQAVSRWESETGYPDIEYIVPIAKFFKVTANYLLDDGSDVSLLEASEEHGENSLCCSFCGKHHEQVKRMVTARSNVNICNECVLICVDIMIPACDS